MKQLQEDLWQSTIHSMGTLNTHAYFLRRPEGNVLFYNTGHDGDLEKIAELGGIQAQLLSHRDESGPSLNRIKDLFGSKLCCSALEAPIIGKDAQVDIAFQSSDQHLGDIAIIHTPGHTDGSICFSTTRRMGSPTFLPVIRFFSRMGSGRPLFSPVRRQQSGACRKPVAIAGPQSRHCHEQCFRR